MTQTFTLCPDAALETSLKTPAGVQGKPAEPSSSVIQNILAFSRNVDVKPSQLMTHINYLKS